MWKLRQMQSDFEFVTVFMCMTSIRSAFVSLPDTIDVIKQVMSVFTSSPRQFRPDLNKQLWQELMTKIESRLAVQLCLTLLKGLEGERVGGRGKGDE